MSQKIRILISCTLLAGTLLLDFSRSSGERIPLTQPLSALPIDVGEWSGQEGTIFPERVLEILKIDDYLVRRYQDIEGNSIWLYIGYWETQERGATYHSPKHCLPAHGWDPLSADRVFVSLAGGSGKLEVNRYVVQKGDQRRLVMYWYDAQGEDVADEIKARYLLLKNAITRNRTHGAMIRTLGPMTGSLDQTFARHVNYIQAMYPVMREFLPQQG